MDLKVFTKQIDLVKKRIQRKHLNKVKQFTIIQGIQGDDIVNNQITLMFILSFE